MIKDFHKMIYYSLIIHFKFINFAELHFLQITLLYNERQKRIYRSLRRA